MLRSVLGEEMGVEGARSNDNQTPISIRLFGGRARFQTAHTASIAGSATSLM